MVGSSGAVFNTTNGGNIWSAVSIGTNIDLNEIYFVNGSVGWIVGAGGLILKTEDGGATWIPQVSNIVIDLHSVCFVNDSLSWAAGKNETIVRTSNGGSDWMVQLSGGDQWINRIQFINSDIGWATGTGGIIYKTINGGINTTGLEKLREGSSSTFSLHQNYPNPFNPATNIEFQIPKSEFVVLKIYNILGEEVATLVSDRLSAGSYSYDWDASQSTVMAGGVYLYRLQSGEYVKTRKMLLMR
jgi:hypothetical protein